MKLEYDPAADALYVRLNDQPIIESEQIKPVSFSITTKPATSSVSKS